MNKTYRIIYNHHTGTYVAVAENTHARGKTSRAGKVLNTVAVGAALALSSMSAMAAVETYGSAGGNPAVSSGIGIGGSCTAGTYSAWVEAEGGLAIGSDCSAQAMAMQQNAISIGNGTYSGENAVALGRFANAAQANSVAIGNQSQALEINSVAIGNAALATQDETVAIGSQAQATGWGAFAMGRNAKADGFQSVAIGNQAHVVDDGVLHSGNYGVAIGDSAKTQSNGIAIGSNAGEFNDVIDPNTNAVIKAYVTTNQIAIGSAAGRYQ